MKFDLPKELLEIAHGSQLDKTILSLAAHLVESQGAGAILKLRSTVIEAAKNGDGSQSITLRQASDLVAAMEKDEGETLSRADKIGSLIVDALGKVGASLIRQLIP